MPVAIGVLGGFEIQDSGGEGRSLNANRLQALVAYLALRLEKPVPRSEVAFKLWPDSSEEQAHTNLRKALHQFRHSFGEAGPIQADAQTVWLHLGEGDRLDLAEFESALLAAAQARVGAQTEAELSALETAAARYRGDLLPNCYDDWLLPDRDRLREAFAQAADRLIELLELRRDYVGALKHAQRLLQIDGLREQSHRALIRLHALNDDRAAALNAYHACARILSQELGVEPDKPTRDLYERLLKGGLAPQREPPVVTTLSHPLVGRDREWSSLIRELSQPVGTRPRLILLSGETGIGKTRLAEDLLRWARRQGIRTASAACYPPEGQFSYAPVARWLREWPLTGLDSRWRAELSRILPELRLSATPPPAITDSWQKQVFFEAMARALLDWPDPSVLLLDDIQWCDADTLAWLSYFLHSESKAAIHLVGALRVDELASNPALESFLMDLRAADQLTEISLGRLSRQQTDLLGTHLLKIVPPPPILERLYLASEGVPLFVVELARDGLSEAAAAQSDAAHEGAASLPPRLRAVLEGKLSRLSTPARSVAESAAIIGRAFDYGLLRKVTELDESTTIAALDELWRRQVIRERGGGSYDFTHDQLREATLSGISTLRRRWLHQRTAEALAAAQPAGEALARIADHFERAGLGLKAAGYYASAARREREFFALTDALEHLNRAILLEPQPAIKAGLQEERGSVLQLLGRREHALRAFQAAFALTQGHVARARLARKMITVSSRFEPEVARSNHDLALDELELGQSEPDFWPEWLETGFAWMEAAYWQQDAAALAGLLLEMKEAVAEHGTPFHDLRYLHLNISCMFLTERYRLGPEHLAFSRTYVDLARSSGDPYQIYTALRVSGMVALCADAFEAAEQLFRESVQLCEKSGDCESLLIDYTYLSLMHRRVHRPRQAKEDTHRLENLLERTSQHPAYEGVAHANQAWLAFRDRCTDEAHRQAHTALECWSAAKAPYPFQWTARFVLYGLSVKEDDLASALRHASCLLAPPQQRLTVDVESALNQVLDIDPQARPQDADSFHEALARAELAGYL